MILPKALLFDFDGTLYSRKGLTFSLLLRQRFHLSKMHKLKQIRRKIAGHEFQSGADLLKSINDSLRSETWYTQSFYPSFIRSLKSRKMRPQLIDFFKNLKNLKIKTALVSDHGLNDRRLAAMGIPTDLFDCLISCEEIGALKPHPKGLLKAAEILSINPAECWMIGDRFDTDAAAAEKAGMKSFILSAQGGGDEAAGWMNLINTFPKGIT